MSDEIKGFNSMVEMYREMKEFIEKVLEMTAFGPEYQPTWEKDLNEEAWRLKKKLDYSIEAYNKFTGRT